MKNYFLIPLLLFSTQAFCFQTTALNARTSLEDIMEASLANANTTLDINNAYVQVLKIADDELNRVYRIITNGIDNDQEKETLKIASRAWINFRDANANWVYTIWEEGSIRNAMAIHKKIDMTMERTRELKEEYRHLFTGIKAEDLLGQWQLTNDCNEKYAFVKKDDQFICQHFISDQLVSEDTITIYDDGYLSFSGEEALSSYVFIQHEKLNSSYQIVLHALKDGGGYRYSMKRVE